MYSTQLIFYLQALTNPIKQVTIETTLTTICGLFFTRLAQDKNATVPNVNATML